MSSEPGGAIRCGWVRNSNIEMLRIILMLFIIAGHYVSGSGVRNLFWSSGTSFANTLFLDVFSLWGKTSINAFVLITGYFMCVGELTPRRVFKLFSEVWFYKVVVWCTLLYFGYETISAKSVMLLLIWPFYSINEDFTTSFLWFYLLIPFFNVFVRSATRSQLYALVGILLFMFTISSSFFLNPHIFHHVFWYGTLYLIGALIRLYPQPWMFSMKVCSLILIVGFAMGVAWCVTYDVLNCFRPLRMLSSRMFVYDSHKLLALVVGGGAFLTFKNLSIGYLPIINKMASTVFGVLLIHTSSDAMRQFLWVDLLKVPDCFHGEVQILVVHAVLCVIGVFCVCSVIDLIRIRFIEKNLLLAFDRIVAKRGDKNASI